MSTQREISWISVREAIYKYGVDIAELETLVKAGEIRHKAVSKEGRLEHHVENSKLLFRLGKRRKSPFEVAGWFFGQAIVATGSTVAATKALQLLSDSSASLQQIDLVPSVSENFSYDIDRSERAIAGIANLLRTTASVPVLRLSSSSIIRIVRQLTSAAMGSGSLVVTKPMASTKSMNLDDFVENCLYGNYHFLVPRRHMTSGNVNIQLANVSSPIPSFEMPGISAETVGIRSRDLFAAIQQLALNASIELLDSSEVDVTIISFAALISDATLYDRFFWD